MIEKLKKDWNNYKVGILAAIIFVAVATLLFGGVCYFKRITGIPCPGCGLTRSFLLILQGKFSQAWELHPFAYGWIVFAIIFLVDRYVLRGKEVLWKIALIVLCMGMLVLYCYRLLTGGLVGL